MRRVLQKIFARSPRFDLRSICVGFLAAALLFAFLLPDAERIEQLVIVALSIGLTAAVICALTFWAKARARVARTLKWRYKVVRRNAAIVALVGLSFFAVQRLSLGLRKSSQLNLSAPASAIPAAAHRENSAARSPVVVRDTKLVKARELTPPPLRPPATVSLPPPLPEQKLPPD